jgi:hypothetical protein
MADNERVDLPAEFDAVLRRTLAVEPSPAFLPRVRERVSQQGRPSLGITPWMLAGAVAAATVALAIGLAWLPRAPVVTPALPVAPASAMAASERPVPPPLAIQPPAPPHPRTIPARPLPAAYESPVAPVVIVDQRQRAALGLFLRMAQQGTLPEDTLAQAVPTPNQPVEEQIPPIAVEPVAVSPIPVGGVLHNEIERN